MPEKRDLLNQPPGEAGICDYCMQAPMRHPLDVEEVSYYCVHKAGGTIAMKMPGEPGKWMLWSGVDVDYYQTFINIMTRQVLAQFEQQTGMPVPENWEQLLAEEKTRRKDERGK